MPCEATPLALVPRARCSCSSLVLTVAPTVSASFLKQLGYDSVLIDADPETGGGKDEDILVDSVFQDLLSRVQASEFLAIFAAPPWAVLSP